MRLRTAGFLVGTAFLAWAAFMYSRIVPLEGNQYTQPLVLPISLAPATITSPEIKTVIDRNYDIVIDLDERRLNGQWMNTDIEWELREGDGVAAHGMSMGKGWQNWAGTVEQTLGTRFDFGADLVFTFAFGATLLSENPRGQSGGAAFGVKTSRLQVQRSLAINKTRKPVNPFSPSRTLT